MEPDFTGWATKYGIKCTDGRTIKHDAFKHSDKIRVPLVWNHMHDDPENTLGYAELEHRAEGVWTRAFFNESDAGQRSKLLVQHGDITRLSIHANGLTEKNKDVYHGNIREVSLVLAGANDGARIENVKLMHGDGVTTLDDEAVIYNGFIEHSDTDENTEGEADMAGNEETLNDIVDSMNEKQKNVMNWAIGEAVKADREERGEDEDGDEDGELSQSGIVLDDEDIAEIKHNAFVDGFKEAHNMPRNDFESADKSLSHGAGATGKPTLSGAQVNELMHAGIKRGSLKDAAEELSHAGTYGVDNLEFLFPDAKTVDASPSFIGRRVEWVADVLAKTKKQPYARIKSIHADITADEARAKGYIKGTQKVEEVFPLLQRTTSPTTVYKKQKLDRDDIIDIKDLDVVAWIKAEMRVMLDEEIARAILIGDGRAYGNPDKIKDPRGATDGVGIRSILHDDDLYSVKIELASNIEAEDQIDAISRSRAEYRGSGSPTFYTTDRNLTDMLHLKDAIKRRLYGTETELASTLRVSNIVAVEVMEQEPEVLGIVVNLIDYTTGTDKGGELSFFEDFDLDFNQEKKLLEARLSGALTVPKSALVIKRALGIEATPAAPSFNADTNTITVPSTTGVLYHVDGNPVASGSLVITKSTEIRAIADEGYYLKPNSIKTWNFTFNPEA